MDDLVNLVEAEGINILLQYEDAVDAKEQELIDAEPLIFDEENFPLVAKGFFDNRGTWRFFATYSADVEYRLEYDEFVEALHETEE